MAAAEEVGHVAAPVLNEFDCMRKQFVKSMDGLKAVFDKVCASRSSTATDRKNFENLSGELVSVFEGCILNVSKVETSTSEEISRERINIKFDSILENVVALNNKVDDKFNNFMKRLENIEKNQNLAKEQNTSTSHMGKSVVSESLLEEANMANRPGLVESVIPSVQKKPDYAEVVRNTQLKSISSYLPIEKSSGSSITTAESQSITKRKSKTIISGANKNSALKTVSKLPNKKAAFVSRIDPSMKICDVRQLLANKKFKHLKIVQMKTKFSSYSSFFVEVFESELNLLLDSEMWPEGSLITEFYGKLHDSQVLVSESD